MRFKHFLHLVKEHNANGEPLTLHVNFRSFFYRRVLSYVRSHDLNFGFMMIDVRSSVPDIDYSCLYDLED